MSAPKIPMGFVSAPGVAVQGYLDARVAKHRNRPGGGEDESALIFRRMQAVNRSFIQNPRFDFGNEVEDRLQSHVQVTHLLLLSFAPMRTKARVQTCAASCTPMCTPRNTHGTRPYTYCACCVRWLERAYACCVGTCVCRTHWSKCAETGTKTSSLAN